MLCLLGSGVYAFNAYAFDISTMFMSEAKRQSKAKVQDLVKTEATSLRLKAEAFIEAANSMEQLSNIDQLDVAEVAIHKIKDKLHQANYEMQTLQPLGKPEAQKEVLTPQGKPQTQDKN